MYNSFKIVESNKSISVAIVNLPNALLSSVVGINDIFHIANQFCTGSDSRSFDVQFLHVDKNLQNFSSTVELDSLEIEFDQKFDVVIIPPIITQTDEIVISQKLTDWLHQMYKEGSYICSVCFGAYILAKAKLLDNKKATTHWIAESKIKEEFPLIKLDVNKIIIEDSNIITAGGVSAYMDLSLYLIRKFLSTESAYECANFLVVDAGRTSQKHYKNMATLTNVLDIEMKNLLEWINQNINYPISISDLAKELKVSDRTLMRRFVKDVGVLPTKYLQNIRVQKAKEMLINTNKSFEQITFDVGYEDISSFRRLFKKMTGLLPREYKNLFMVK